MGVPGGGVERIFGPHLTAVLPIQHRGPKGNLMEEEWGLLAGGGSTESWAHLTAVLLIQRIDRCTVYRFPFAHARWAAIASRTLLPRRQHLPADRAAWVPHPRIYFLQLIGQVR